MNRMATLEGKQIKTTTQAAEREISLTSDNPTDRHCDAGAVWRSVFLSVLHLWLVCGCVGAAGAAGGGAPVLGPPPLTQTQT